MNQRDSVTSEMMRPSIESCMRPSTDSAGAMAVIADALHLRINNLSQTNARIKKMILKFAELNDSQRKEVRTMMQEAMEIAGDIERGVKK